MTFGGFRRDKKKLVCPKIVTLSLGIVLFIDLSARLQMLRYQSD
jgi:hypothetical protein